VARLIRRACKPLPFSRLPVLDLAALRLLRFRTETNASAVGDTLERIAEDPHEGGLMRRTTVGVADPPPRYERRGARPSLGGTSNSDGRFQARRLDEAQQSVDGHALEAACEDPGYRTPGQAGSVRQLSVRETPAVDLSGDRGDELGLERGFEGASPGDGQHPG
jgi:hypothetical protein